MRTACWGTLHDPKCWASIKTWEEGKIITDGELISGTVLACLLTSAQERRVFGLGEKETRINEDRLLTY